jgi:hypothetical protein
LADLLGGRIIAVRPVLIDLIGTADAAAMVSQAIYWSQRTRDADGWFYKTESEWFREIRVSAGRQRRSRMRLRSFGNPRFWFEKRKGMPRRLYFRLDLSALHQHLTRLKENEAQCAQNDSTEDTSGERDQLVQNDSTDGRESNLLVVPNRIHISARNKRTSGTETSSHLTESTSETTDRGGGRDGKAAAAAASRRPRATGEQCPSLFLPFEPNEIALAGTSDGAPTAIDAFKEIGHEALFGQPSFQAIWVAHYREAKRNGGWITAAMEAAIQECQKLKIGVPPQFYEAKKNVLKNENAEFDRRYRRAPL